MDAPRAPGGERLDYPELLRGALLSLVRQVLERIAREGLPGEHHFYLTFDTRAPGVALAEPLRSRYPEEMTVVLQNQFWNLEVGGESFSVTLRFGGAPQRVTVPWRALTAFVDPSVPFGLKLVAEAPAPQSQPQPPAAAAPAAREGPEPDAKVLAFPRGPRNQVS
jgi:hypothetical protein